MLRGNCFSEGQLLRRAPRRLLLTLRATVGHAPKGLYENTQTHASKKGAENLLIDGPIRANRLRVPELNLFLFLRIPFGALNLRIAGLRRFVRITRML